MPFPSTLLSRRRNRLALGAAVALLGVRLILPVALERGIEWGGERSTGVPVEVDDVDLALLRGGITLEGLVVGGVGRARSEAGDIDHESALVRWELASANLEWLDLLRGRIRLSELRVAGPTGRIELDEHGAPLLPEPAADPDADEAVIAEPEPGAEPESGAEREPGGEPESGADAQEESSGWPILLDSFELTDVRMQLQHPAHEEAVVALGLAGFSLTDVTVRDGAISLGGVGLQRPSIRVQRDYVFAPAEAEAPAEQAPAGGPGSTHRIERIQLDHADFTLLTERGPLDVSLRLDASGVSTARGQTFPLDLGLQVGPGTIVLNGRVGISPASFEGRLRWQDLPLPPLALAADPELSAWIRSCRASGDLAVTASTEAQGDTAAALAASGRLALHAFHFEDPDEREARVQFEALEVELSSLNLPLGRPAAPAEVSIAKVRLTSPKVRYVAPAPALDALLAGEEGDGGEAPEGAGEATDIRVDRIELSDGDVRFEDRSVTPHYQGRLASLKASVDDFRLPAGSARVNLTGRAPGGSPFALNGRLGDRTRLEFELRQLALSQFNPYAVGASGYSVERGAASIVTTVEGSGDEIEIGNDLVLHELGLAPVGERILDDVIGVPVDVALALLRDLEGNISLGIPLTVESGNMRVGIGSILRSALRAAVAGAITSPLKMMGAAFSLAEGGLSVPPIEMEPGTATLAAGQEEELSALLSLLSTRPELGLTLSGHSDEDDRDGLALRLLVEQAAAGEDLPDVEGAGFFAKRSVKGELARRSKGASRDLDADEQALLERYVAATFVPPARFDVLARERAAAARNYLVETQGLEAERVEVLPATATGKPGVVVGFGAVREAPEEPQTLP